MSVPPPERFSWEMAATAGLCPLVTQVQELAALLTISLEKAGCLNWRVTCEGGPAKQIVNNFYSWGSSVLLWLWVSPRICTADKRGTISQRISCLLSVACNFTSINRCLIYTHTYTYICTYKNTKFVFMLIFMFMHTGKRKVKVHFAKTQGTCSRAKKKELTCLYRWNGLSLNFLHKTKMFLFDLGVSLF